MVVVDDDYLMILVVSGEKPFLKAGGDNICSRKINGRSRPTKEWNPAHKAVVLGIQKLDFPDSHANWRM
jgi:hypothetical protein